MRIKITFFAVLGLGILALLLGGCSYSTIHLIRKNVQVDIGSDLSTDLSDYVRASNANLSMMSLDISKVDMNTLGEYQATITFGEENASFTVTVTDTSAPVITLKNNEIYFENTGTLSLKDIVSSVTDFSEYEYGFSDDMTLADSKKKMKETLNYDAIGDYNGEVIAKDTYGNISVSDFVIHIVETGKIPTDAVSVTDYAPFMNTEEPATLKTLGKYDTEAVYFGLGKDRDSETNRPLMDYYVNLYGEFAVDFIQPESNFIWLTFHEVTEYGNTEKILDILKEKEVKAVFFVTLDYVKKNPELIQRMLDEGHVLGNYTATGQEVGELSVKKLTSEINTLYNYVYETYGYKMYLFRPPSGYYSEQTLAVAQSLGYRTVFWSFAYADWDIENQPDVDTSLKNALKQAHKGGIYLLSGSSSTNRKMLSDLIDGIREKGYEFAIYQNNQF